MLERGRVQNPWGVENSEWIIHLRILQLLLEWENNDPIE